MKKQNGKASTVVVWVVLASLAAFLLPWKKINWGKFEMTPTQTIVVVGEARSQQKNQIASFTAGVDVVNDNREVAVKDVSGKIEALVLAVKKFGIEDKDVKTSNLSFYQNEETYWDNGVQKTRKGQWRVNNSIEITLRQVDQASTLADILSASGANNVWGPNFTMDDTREIEKTLFGEAMQNARDKAEIIAKSAGRKLGKIYGVTEGNSGSTYSLYKTMDGAGGGAPMEPGSGLVSKSLTVVFEVQ
ncbi:MAG: SIMPL domain-containing protein [Candidatus Shapirobacteria bacterium]